MARPLDARKATKDDRALARRAVRESRRRDDIVSLPDGYALRIIIEAKRQGIRVSDAFAMVEQETGFRNVFGCDHGAGRAFCHENVTAARVRTLLASNLANGVGPTQLTSKGYVRMADKHGGAHKVSVNLATGIAILAGMQHKLGRMKGFGAYNGGEGNPNMTYAWQCARRAARWHRALA